MAFANKALVASRLRKLEQELLPPPREPTVILHRPAADAPAAEQEAFERELAAARQVRAKVWVVTGEPVVDMDPVADVTFVQHEWQAWVGVLAHTPSAQGRPNALHDLFAGLSGNIIRPNPAMAAPDAAGEDDDDDRLEAPSARVFEAQPQGAGDCRRR